jgi:hypothetical protein
MQLAGVAVDVALAGIPCLLMCLFFEKTTGLRVSEAEEIAGLDATFWNIENYGDEPAVAASNGRAEEAAALGGLPVTPASTSITPPTY